MAACNHSRSSSPQVSKVILGCMSYGSSKWQDWVLDEEASLPLFKAAYDAGITTYVSDVPGS